ncbi:MAG: hypothetical protein M1831_006875 [Alyxoria varia]|nr:MAG: hypothetical protein M1831_006875 [Alyxoria varia]
MPASITCHSTENQPHNGEPETTVDIEQQDGSVDATSKPAASPTSLASTSESKEMLELFSQHPVLKKQLQELYEQTLEPSEYKAEQFGPAGKRGRDGRGRHRGQTGRWTQRGADKRVIQAIQNARSNPASANDIALRAFANLVLEKGYPAELK